MKEFLQSSPLLDDKEGMLLEKLTKEYESFLQPSFLSKAGNKTLEFIGKVTPKKVKKLTMDTLDLASEADLIKMVIAQTAQGFGVLQKETARFFVDKNAVLKAINKKHPNVESFDHICVMRSYHLELIVEKKKYIDLSCALVEGACTGAPGLIGVPFNIALSFLLYFRAVQSTALYYGYDIDDPRELEIASAVTMMSLAPTIEDKKKTLTGMLGKMMMSANLSSLKKSLVNETYKEMAAQGGAELFYVQVRALANKSAAKALKAAGKEGIEGSIFQKCLKQIGKNLSKETGKKAIPIVGAVIGGLSDTYYMNRVLVGANLIYHKRFLIEKEQRAKLIF